MATFLSCLVISNVEHTNRVGDSSTKNQTANADPINDGCIVSDEPIRLNENNEKLTSIFITESITIILILLKSLRRLGSPLDGST